MLRAAPFAVALLLSTSLALAAPNGASKLKAEGDRAMDEARPADALAAYEKSYELQPTPALLYNQARAHMALTNFPRALEFLRRFEQEAKPALKAKVPLVDLIAEVSSKIHTLTVEVNVAGATVRLADTTLGQTPLSPNLRVNAGHAILEVQANGYKLARRELDLPGRASSKVVFKLESSDDQGTINLRSSQPGVRAVLSNGSKGTLPLELRLPRGTYALDLSKEGYESLHTSIAVNAGDRLERSFELSKRAPLITRWWFWTAIGVVAAGSVTAIVIANTARGPDTGTIAPGRVSNGLSF